MRFLRHFCLKTRMNIAYSLLCALLLCACATPQTAQLVQTPPAHLPAQHLIANVPFFAQQEHQCGPATLAMVLNHWGKRITPEELTPQMFLPGRAGSLQPELLAASRRQGMLAVPTAPTLTAVFAEVAAGNPVIVLQNLSLPIAPVWHYAAVIGYDMTAQTVILHSGTTAQLRMSFTAFENTWARGKHWAVTVTPPQRLPAGADDAAVLAAAAALERTDSTAAASAYRAALIRWSGSSTAWIGLGNIAFAGKDARQAVLAYRQAVTLAPASADAWHNLAWAHDALGEKAQAVDAAKQAVNLGGVRFSRYQETLKALQSK
jgi:tetratricopeptide (TPR) repeat protein